MLRLIYVLPISSFSTLLFFPLSPATNFLFHVEGQQFEGGSSPIFSLANEETQSSQIRLKIYIRSGSQCSGWPAFAHAYSRMHLQEWVTLSFLRATMALISILHHPWKDNFISTWLLSVREHPTLYSQNQTCKCTPLKHICLSLLIEMANHSPSYLTSRACTFLLSFPSVSFHLQSTTAWAMVFLPIPPFTFLYYFNKYFC